VCARACVGVCVFGTNTSAGTYCAFEPIALWALAHFLGREMRLDRQVS